MDFFFFIKLFAKVLWTLFLLSCSVHNVSLREISSSKRDTKIFKWVFPLNYNIIPLSLYLHCPNQKTPRMLWKVFQLPFWEILKFSETAKSWCLFSAWIFFSHNKFKFCEVQWAENDRGNCWGVPWDWNDGLCKFFCSFSLTHITHFMDQVKRVLNSQNIQLLFYLNFQLLILEILIQWKKTFITLMLPSTMVCAWRVLVWGLIYILKYSQFSHLFDFFFWSKSFLDFGLSQARWFLTLNQR